MKKGLLALAACLATTAAPAFASLYLIGEPAGEWSPKLGIEMTETGPNEYTYEGNMSQGWYFGFAKELNIDGKWDIFNNNNNRYKPSGESKVTTGNTYNCGYGDGSWQFDAESGQYKIVFNTSGSGSFTVTKIGEIDPSDIVYGIKGTYNGGNDWINKNMTNDNGVWTLTVDITNADFAFGISEMANNSQVGWFDDSKGVTIAEGSPIAVRTGVDSNFKITAGDGKYTFTWVPETKTLTVKKIIPLDWAIKIGDQYIDLTDTNGNGVYNIVTNARVNQPFQLVCYEEGKDMTDPNNQIALPAYTIAENTDAIQDGKFVADAQYYIAYNTNTSTLIINKQGDYQYSYVLKYGDSYIELSNEYNHWHAFNQSLNTSTPFQIIPYYEGEDYKQAANQQPAVDATLVEGSDATQNGTSYTVTSNGSYTIRFNPAMKTLDVHSSENRWWIAYNITGTWEFGIPMEVEADGNTWKASIDFTGSTVGDPYFGLFYGKKSSNWNDATRYNLNSTSDFTVDDMGGTFNLVTANNGVTRVAPKQWTIEVNNSAKTVTFSLGDSMGAANILITRNGETTSYGMTETEDGVFTATESIAQGDKLYFDIEGKKYFFNRDSQSTEVEYTEDNSEVIYSYVLKEYPASTATSDMGVEFWYSTEVDFTININDLTAKISVPTEGVTMGLGNNMVVPFTQNADGLYTWSGEIPEETHIRVNIFGTRYTIDTNSVGVSDEADENGCYTYQYELIPINVENDIITNWGTIRASQGECTLIVNPENLTLQMIDEKEPSQAELEDQIILNDATSTESDTKPLTFVSEGVYTWTGTVTATQIISFRISGKIYGLEPAEASANSIATIAAVSETKNYNIVEGSDGTPLGIEGTANFNINLNTMKATADVTTTVDDAKIILTEMEDYVHGTGIVWGESTEEDLTYSSADKTYSATIYTSANDCVVIAIGDEKYTFNPNAAVSSTEGVGEYIHVYNLEPVDATNPNGYQIGVGGGSEFIVDPAAKTVTLKNQIETGVAGLDAEEGEAVFFNMQGQRVENPAEGIYIRVVGGKAEKVLVK